MLSRRLALGLGVEAIGSPVWLGLCCDDDGCVVQVVVFPRFQRNALLLVASVGVGHIVVFQVPSIAVLQIVLIEGSALLICSFLLLASAPVEEDTGKDGGKEDWGEGHDEAHDEGHDHQGQEEGQWSQQAGEEGRTLAAGASTEKSKNKTKN